MGRARKMPPALAGARGVVTIVKADDWLLREVERLVDEAWIRWARDGAAIALYVWFRRGSIVAAEDKPAGYELAFAEKLPTHLERAGCHDWVYRRMRSLPCLPEEV